MQDKKVLALIILTVLAVISLIYGVTAPPKGRARSAAVIETRFAAPAPGAQGAISTRRRAKRSRFREWKRNPFVKVQAAPVITELKLNGIIWNKTNPKAMIGDAIVVKGDTVGINKVIDIQPDKVILNDGTKDFELTL